MEATTYATTDSPIGEILVIGNDRAVHNLYMNGDGGYEDLKVPLKRDQKACKQVLAQLDEYFTGKRTDFDLPLSPKGTEFQRAVWKALEEIPYGETRSYGEIARAVGRPKAARAVGMANNRNPISVIVPCHRVIGADGSLVGYGGGLSRKTWLLDHERAVARRANSSS